MREQTQIIGIFGHVNPPEKPQRGTISPEEQYRVIETIIDLEARRYTPEEIALLKRIFAPPLSR